MADNRIAYGLAKKYGIDTTGMSPKEVWAALADKGVTELGGHNADENVYKSVDELKDQQSIDQKKDDIILKQPKTRQGYIDRYGLDGERMYRMWRVNEQDRKDALKRKQENDKIIAQAGEQDNSSLKGQRIPIRTIENANRGLSQEIATIYDKSGKIIDSIDGTSNQVIIKDAKALKGATFTHNHPKGTMFSSDDISSFVTTELHQMRATTPNGRTFVLTRVTNNIPIELADDYKKAVGTKDAKIIIQQTYEDYYNDNPNGGYDNLLKAQSDYLETWLSQNAENYGVEFSIEEE